MLMVFLSARRVDSLLRLAGRVSPRRATYFLLLRQKKVGKEKATRSLGPLRYAPGQPCIFKLSRFAAERQTTCNLELAVRTAAPVNAQPDFNPPVSPNSCPS